MGEVERGPRAPVAVLRALLVSRHGLLQLHRAIVEDPEFRAGLAAGRADLSRATRERLGRQRAAGAMDSGRKTRQYCRPKITRLP